MTLHSIAGEWRGHYAYRHRPDHGSGFSAFLTEAAGLISGSVIDDEFPGKATVQGSFAFPNVQFTKTYVNPTEQKEIIQEGNRKMLLISNSRSSVEYSGSMTEDGKTMNGTWLIDTPNGFGTGTWVAHRLQEEVTEVAEEVGESLSFEE